MAVDVLPGEDKYFYMWLSGLGSTDRSLEVEFRSGYSTHTSEEEVVVRGSMGASPTVGTGAVLGAYRMDRSTCGKRGLLGLVVGFLYMMFYYMFSVSVAVATRYRW